MARTNPKTVADKIKQVCTDAFLKKEKPSRQYIKKAMAEKYDYTNESIIKMLLGSMVKYGKLIQKGQTFYARDFVPEDDEQQEEEFESKHDYMPGFLEALGELTDLYEKEDDFRATSFRRAITALEGQIITSVEDIKLFNPIELKGVGKSTLTMLEEFITSGKIEKLEEKRSKHDYMPGFRKTLETAGYDNMDMYGLSRHVLPVHNVNDLDKVKDKVKPEILEMFKEYIETKKIKKLTKTLCEAFIKDHEPLRYYFLKKPVYLVFDKDAPEWNYSGKAQQLDIVISGGFYEHVFQEHDFEDDEYDIDQLRNKVQEIQERFDNGDSTTRHNFEGSFTIDGVSGQHPFVFHRYADDSDTGLESLGWTPPGLENFLNNELMGERGMWDNRDSDSDSKPANPDQVGWFSDLTIEQAGYIQDYWDSEGERKWATT